ncbi:hypothetical protein LWI28_015054 [Acer negundo]|uniref:Uncharacterized protein n=1 Tax=Acer negundo TaxID=4023 RepID=A0AAD5P4E5_ACENE|nr:hypothetical protein LWI28_015054 [Acer negundo]
MRTAALPSFRKLYGRIEEDLDAGDVVVVHLMNNYNTYSFSGKKKLVLSTSGCQASPFCFFSSLDLLFFLDLVNKETQEVGIILLSLLHFLFSIILMLLLIK